MEANFLKEKFVDCYKKEVDAVFRFCIMRVSNKEQAMDITQEAFTHFWQTLKKGNEIRNYRAFIFSITNRLIIDWYRKKKTISLDNDEDLDRENFDCIPDDNHLDLEAKAEARFLLGKIKKITENNRNAVYLRYVEDLSLEEIANTLGISKDATSVRINRGLKELKMIMHYNRINKKNDD